MKQTKTIEMPARIENRSDGLACDSCGARSDIHERWDPESDYRGTVTKVEMSQEGSYPEGGSREGISWDLCPKCFKKLVEEPLLAAGVKPSKVEVDW